jgi:chorismate mutase
MSLKAYREQIDSIDKSLIEQLEKRMLISGLIGKLNRRNGILEKTLDREEEIRTKIRKKRKKIKNIELFEIYDIIFKISTLYQNRNKNKKKGKPINVKNAPISESKKEEETESKETESKETESKETESKETESKETESKDDDDSAPEPPPRNHYN